MVSETTLGVLFCFLLPVAVTARFWNWYKYFKRGEQLKLARQQAENDDQP